MVSAYYTLSVTSYSSYSQLHSYVIPRCSSLRPWLGSDARSVSWLEVSDQLCDTSATGFGGLFDGFMSLTSYFDVKYRY